VECRLFENECMVGAIKISSRSRYRVIASDVLQLKFLLLNNKDFHTLRDNLALDSERT